MEMQSLQGQDASGPRWSRHRPHPVSAAQTLGPLTASEPGGAVVVMVKRVVSPAGQLGLALSEGHPLEQPLSPPLPAAGKLQETGHLTLTKFIFTLCKPVHEPRPQDQY